MATFEELMRDHYEEFVLSIEKARKDGLIVDQGAFGYGARDAEPGNTCSICALSAVRRGRGLPKWEPVGSESLVPMSAASMMGWNLKETSDFVSAFDDYDPENGIDPFEKNPYHLLGVEVAKYAFPS